VEGQKPEFKEIYNLEELDSVCGLNAADLMLKVPVEQ